MTVRAAERSDKYDQLLQLADVFDRSGDELRSMAGLGAEVLRDDAVADSADLSSASHARAEEDIRAATTGKQGLLSRSIELDADALVVRATVLTYQWIDELRDAASASMGAIAGRAIGYLAPNVALGGAIVTAGLIETDALDRDGVAAFLSELAAANPELLDQVVSGGGGLLDGLQMRAALTAGFFSGESGRRAARGGLRAMGVDTMRQDSSAALRDVAGWLARRTATARRRAARGRGTACPLVAGRPDGDAGVAGQSGARAPHGARSLRRLRRAPARRSGTRGRAGAAASVRRPHPLRRRGRADHRRRHGR